MPVEKVKRQVQGSGGQEQGIEAEDNGLDGIDKVDEPKTKAREWRV